MPGRVRPRHAYFFAAFAGAAALNAAPLTVSPSAENLVELPARTPLTRACRSAQSLNAPVLRASRILADIDGPMPLIDSSSARLALFTSTTAKAAAEARASTAVTRVLTRFMVLSEGLRAARHCAPESECSGMAPS